MNFDAPSTGLHKHFLMYLILIEYLKVEVILFLVKIGLICCENDDELILLLHFGDCICWRFFLLFYME
jgi:hypothetical protein